jgi:hypothetical protein
MLCAKRIHKSQAKPKSAKNHKRKQAEYSPSIRSGSLILWAGGPVFPVNEPPGCD